MKKLKAGLFRRFGECKMNWGKGKMKKILCALGVSLLIAGGAQAELVFSEDFDGRSIYYKNSGAIEFGGQTRVGEWFSAANGVAIDNELQLTHLANNRSRGTGVWLLSSEWATGTVTVAFDVLDYTAGGTGSESFFQAYYATGKGGQNKVGLDLHGAGGVDPIATTVSGTATIGTIGARNTIAGNVTQVEYTFDFTGQGNIALVFHNMSANTDTAMPVYSVDNLTVNTIPEPATLGLVCGVGVAVLFIRRRLVM